MHTAHTNASASSLGSIASTISLDARTAPARPPPQWSPRAHEPVLVSLDPRRQVWHAGRTLDGGVLRADGVRTYKVRWMGALGWRVQSGFAPAAENMVPCNELD